MTAETGCDEQRVHRAIAKANWEAWSGLPFARASESAKERALAEARKIVEGLRTDGFIVVAAFERLEKGEPDRCLTCGWTNQEYIKSTSCCPDPWHGQAKLSQRSIT